MFSNPFDGAMYAQMAAAAAMGDLMRAGQTQAEEEAIETAEVHRKEEPEAPAAFDKDMLARLAKQAAEKKTQGDAKPREPSPIVERQQAETSEGVTPMDITSVEPAQTFRLPAAFKKKMEKQAAETFLEPQAASQVAPETQPEVQAFSTEHEEPERNIFREPSPEPVLIPVHPVTLKPLKDGKSAISSGGIQAKGFGKNAFPGAMESNSGGKGPNHNLQSIVDNVVGSLQKNLAQTVLSAKVAPPAIKPDSVNRSSSSLLPKADLYLPGVPKEEEEQLPIIRPPPLVPHVDPDEKKISEAQRIAEQIEKNRKEEEEEERKRRDRDRDRNRGSDRDRDRGNDRVSDVSDRDRGNDNGVWGSDRGGDRGSGRDREGGGGSRRFQDRDDDRGRRRSRSRSRRARRSRSRSRSRSRKRKRPNLFSAAPPEERISSKLSSGSIADRVAAVAEVSGYAGAVDQRSVSLQAGEVPDWLKDLANPTPTQQPSGFYMGRKVLRMPGVYIKCLIGKGGETIRNIRTRTGADIKVEGRPDDSDAVLSIAGNIKVAEGMIRETLESKGCMWEAQEVPGALLGTTTTNIGMKQYDEFEDLKIPSQLVPLLIGNNGCGYKEIRARTGGQVTIKVLPNCWNDNTQSVHVFGDNWKVARQIIREKIDHIKKTTPGPWQAGYASNVGQVEHRNLNANNR